MSVPPRETTAVAIERVLADVEAELRRAMCRFESMHSPHEGIAVIEEEYLELRKHVHENTGRSPAARAEAIQVAAMGLRYVLDLCAPAAPDVRKGVRCDNHDLTDCPICLSWAEESRAREPEDMSPTRETES